MKQNECHLPGREESVGVAQKGEEDPDQILLSPSVLWHSGHDESKTEKTVAPLLPCPVVQCGRQEGAPRRQMIAFVPLWILSLTFLLAMLFPSSAFPGNILIIKYNNATPFQEAEKALKTALVKKGYHEKQIHSITLPPKGAPIPSSIHPRSLDGLFLLGNSVVKRYAGNPTLKNIPKVYLMATKPIRENSWPDGGLSGVSLDLPAVKKLEALKSVFPKNRSVGIIYSSSSVNLVQTYKEAAEETGLKLITFLVDSPGKVQKAFDEIRTLSDMLLLIPDRILLTRENRAFFFKQGDKFPICGLTRSYVKKRLLVSVDVDYKEQGRIASRIFFDLRNHKEKQSLHPQIVHIYVNREVAENLHMKISSDNVVYLDGGRN